MRLPASLAREGVRPREAVASSGPAGSVARHLRATHSWYEHGGLPDGRAIVLVGSLQHEVMTANGVDGRALLPYGEVLVAALVTRPPHSTGD